MSSSLIPWFFVHDPRNNLTLVHRLIKACMCVVSFAPKLSLERVDTFVPTKQTRKSRYQGVKLLAQGIDFIMIET